MNDYQLEEYLLGDISQYDFNNYDSYAGELSENITENSTEDKTDAEEPDSYLDINRIAELYRAEQEAEEKANSLESEPLNEIEEEIFEATTVPENNDVENKEKDLPARKYIGRTSHLTKAEYEEAKKLKAEGKTYKDLFKQFGFASEKSMRNAFSKGISRFRDSK